MGNRIRKGGKRERTKYVLIYDVKNNLVSYRGAGYRLFFIPLQQ